MLRPRAPQPITRADYTVRDKDRKVNSIGARLAVHEDALLWGDPDVVQHGHNVLRLHRDYLGIGDQLGN